MRIGVDVGGTFTDLIAQDRRGRVRVVKTDSTPADPSVGVMNAIRELLDGSDVAIGDVTAFYHGTTVTTNAVIEDEGAETGLLITDGYDAVPVVGDQTRPETHTSNPLFTETDDAFIVPPSRTTGVPERVESDGSVGEPLDEAAVREAVRAFEAAGVESIAVCYLFSYANDEHEQRTRELIAEEFPECFVSLSADVLPKIREYPRLSTTAIDAYVRPILESYVTRLRGKLGDAGLDTDQVYLMLSHGGLVPFETAAATPSRSLLSGPAAGVEGGRFFGEAAGEADLVTMDMGGTSCDVSIVRDGVPSETQSGEINDQPLAFPMIEISTIGAGGGTQARVESGRLGVGPESSGADPGPICYGRGGEIPTVTDANVVLGRLNPEALLGGEIDVAFDRTREIFEREIADPLSRSVTRAAGDVLQVVNDKMKKEITLQLSRYGYDAREFSLVAFGGGGPTHAANVADKLGMERVIVPPWPGINSAAGLLSTDVRQHYVESDLSPLAALDPADVEANFAALEERAVADRRDEGFEAEEIALERKLDLRYEGQGYELTIDVDAGTPDLDRIAAAFDDSHESRFGHRSDEPTELVNYRVASVIEVADLDIETDGTDASDGVGPREHRDVYYPSADEYVRTPVYDRGTLPVGHRLDGPAVLEQLDTTTVVEPSHALRVDDSRNVIVEVG